jgi:prenyl protein peptidase
MASVLFVCTLSPVILSLFSSSSDGPLAQPLFAWLGLRTSYFILAAVIPVILTMVLFSGPIIMYIIDWKTTAHIDTSNDKPASQMLWLRNYVVAPFAEEFTFRACMLPVLWPHFQLIGSVIVCPLFFGFAHIHHVIEKFSMNDGTPAVYIWMEALFQLMYTSVFGAYTSYVFLRTGQFCLLCFSMLRNLSCKRLVT